MQLTRRDDPRRRHGRSDPFAVFEYALDPDATDDVLLVNLAGDGEILFRHERRLTGWAGLSGRRRSAPP